MFRIDDPYHWAITCPSLGPNVVSPSLFSGPRFVGAPPKRDGGQSWHEFCLDRSRASEICQLPRTTIVFNISSPMESAREGEGEDCPYFLE